MKDMEELLFTHGFILLHDPPVAADEAKKIVRNAFRRSNAIRDDRIRRERQLAELTNGID